VLLNNGRIRGLLATASAFAGADASLKRRLRRLVQTGRYLASRRSRPQALEGLLAGRR